MLFAILCLLVSYYELRTSRFQAWYFSKVAQDLTFRLKPGQSNSIRFPKYGPHDIRLGYTKIPQFVKYFSKEGFYVEAQAEISDRLLGLIDRGIFPIYREKTQAGLQIFDRYNKLVYSVRRPGKVYSSFESIPQIVVDSLLFIENREILDSDYPYRNPAVEWDRFAYALYEKFLQIFQPQRSATGGSTIATQLEKYLHSYEGRTRNASDKLQQMLSASYRAYLEGEKTYGVRREIVLDYINSIPLSALPGYGEVNGLSDGLKAWYSVDLEEVNSLLSEYSQENAKFNAQKYAMAYKQVLSLFIAHRRPS